MTKDAPVPVSTENVRSRLFSGLRWTGLSQVFQQVFNLASSIILARLLAPEDFGVLAMASVFTGVVFFVLDLGLSAALVQQKELREEQISSAFWLNVFAGIVFTLLGIGSSWVIAGIYNNPAVQPIVVLLSFNFLFSALGRTQVAILNRRLDYRSLEMRTLVAQFVGVTIGIGMALTGFGVWSLVGRILATGMVEMVMLWSVSGWRPRWCFQWTEVKSLIGFSTDHLTASFLNYFGRNADNFLIGKFLGSVVLGYYAVAYNLMTLPVQRFVKVLCYVMFPAMSRLQEDPDKLKRSWLRAIRLIGAVIVPLLLGLIILAPQFVQVVYGERWLPVAALLRVLSISGIVQSLGSLSEVVLLSMGQTRLRLRLTFVSVTLATIAFIVGLPYGIMGVAICFVIASTIGEVFFLFKTVQRVGLSFRRYVSNLAGVLLAGGGMSLAVWFLAVSLPLNSAQLLAATIPIGAIVYLVLLRLVAPQIFEEVLNILPKRFLPSWLKVG